jgi:GTPase SAR1 family protein
MKNFKIITLGASGAGKTVFLASMFKALSTQKNSSFKLDVEDPDKRKLLNSTYTQILTGDTWPPGTKNISEWTFTCQIQTEDFDKYNACQFTYFDYAGGCLTDIEKDEDLENVVQQADTVLGLLDGQKIYAWLNGSDRPRANVFLSTDLPNILKRMQKLTVPVHFVITKWDVLDQKFTLSQIREKLLTIPAFAQLIKSRGEAGSIVRIIPVSAIGLGFATLQPDGSMKKNPGKIPFPFLLEAPISCVLPDRLQQLHNQKQAQEKQLEQQIQKIDNGNIVVGALVGGLDFLGVGLEGLGLLLEFDDTAEIRMARLFTKATSMVTSLVKGGIKGINEKISKGSRKKKETTLKSVKDEQSALIHAMNVFYDFEKDLIDSFPESKLV